MSVTPVPLQGAVVVERDRGGRALRVSAHPERSRVVLSLWDGNRCIGTLRLAPQDVPDVVRALTAAAVAQVPHLPELADLTVAVETPPTAS